LRLELSAELAVQVLQDGSIHSSCDGEPFVSARGRDDQEEIRAILCAPLQLQERRIGVIYACDLAERGFTAHEINLMAALANEATVAITNATLYREARDKATALSAMVQEMHHRIKNNLQTVADLLSLEMIQAGDGVRDELSELNNSGHDAGPTRIVVPPPADLSIGTITVPGHAVLGVDATITYSVTNLSSEAALGSWIDSIFLSLDEIWDVNDALFGRVDHSGGLAAGASYAETLTKPVPGLAPGQYHVIIRSDIRNNLPESNEGNNIGVSLDRAEVDAPVLRLGVAASGTLRVGGSVYYKIDVPAGETLRLLRRWGRLHAVRTTLGAVGLLAFLWALRGR